MFSLADDLIESFFSIVHPRIPMLDPASFRARFAAPDDHPDGPLPHNLVAVIMAYGSRFSDHPIIAHDRDELTARDDTRMTGRGAGSYSSSSFGREKSQRRPRHIAWQVSTTCRYWSYLSHFVRVSRRYHCEVCLLTPRA